MVIVRIESLICTYLILLFLFVKVERIQSYNANDWNYIDQLTLFVDGGMADISFINTVSEIVTGAIGDR